jgi:Rap1a immunity proteins
MLKSILRLLIVLCLSISLSSKSDAQGGQSLALTFTMTANQLYAYCDTDSPPCAYYISGVIDFLNFRSQASNEPGVCAPAGTSITPLRLSFRNYAEQHPELLNLNAAMLVSVAEVEAFPCPKKP